MKPVRIARGKITWMRSYGPSILGIPVLTLDSRRFLCSPFVYFSAQLNREYFYSYRGKHLIALLPASGDRPSMSEIFQLLLPKRNRKRESDAMHLAQKAIAYDFSIHDCGHYGLFFFDDDEENGEITDYSEEDFEYYSKEANDAIEALNAIGAAAFSENLIAAREKFYSQVRSGTIQSRKPRDYRAFDETFFAIKPSLDQEISRFIENNAREIFSALPEYALDI